MLNGLDLFTGIGGMSLALSPWCRPIAYCENDRFAQGVILSRISDLSLPNAPIWDDVRSLKGGDLRILPDIIYGGFPCQDISCAQRNPKGLEGKRSILVFELLRLCEECRPTFVFLENVPTIRTRGGEQVGKALAALGYDCRWDIVSALEMGAPHKRERWFLAAYSADAERESLRKLEQWRSARRTEAISTEGETKSLDNGIQESVAHVDSVGGLEGLEGLAGTKVWERTADIDRQGWWGVEPDVDRVAYGIPARMDRIRGLGNAVVPIQAREAFKRLMGIQ